MLTKEQVINDLERLLNGINAPKSDPNSHLLSYHLERDGDDWGFAIYHNDGFRKSSLVAKCAIANWNGILNDPFRPLRNAIKCQDLIERIQDALGTTEEGDALVQVARNAHQAEQELAQDHLNYAQEHLGDDPLGDFHGRNE